MKIAVAGGTGFVGKALVHELVKNKHQVVILTRKSIKNPEHEDISYVQWLTPDSNPVSALNDIDVFVNLAGESINSGRWTDERKAKILSSRLEAVDAIYDIMAKLPKKPKVYLNASAVGIYGISNEKVFTEEDSIVESDFLSDTVHRWEERAQKATALGIRTVLCRFGIILDKNEGALPKIVFPYKAFIGGNIGTGKQWMSWIHINDVVKAMLFIINHEQISGPVNFTAPTPVVMKKFGQTLSEVLHRPHWLPVPGIALRVLLGEMSTLVVDGQKVLPKKLIEHGYSFLYPDLKTALKNILS